MIIAALATARLGVGLTIVGIGMSSPDWVVFLSRTKPFIIATPSIGFVVDGLIAGSISWHLLKDRDRMGAWTQSILNALLMYSVSTGAVTTIINALEIVAILALPNTLAYLAFILIQSKLYANCYLAMLNARRAILEKHAGTHKSVLLPKPERKEVKHSRSRSAGLEGIAVTSERVVAVDMPLETEEGSHTPGSGSQTSTEVTLVIV
jgi:hypothetical protein